MTSFISFFKNIYPYFFQYKMVLRSKVLKIIWLFIQILERFIKVNLPHFSRSNANTTHNYYFLNEQGKDAINRILCVFEYKYPDITFCPGIVSIASLLLHYMREHEVARILCILYSTKDHLMLTRINWNSSCSVFKKLMQKHFVRIFLSF